MSEGEQVLNKVKRMRGILLKGFFFPAPSSITCGDSFPRPGEAFSYQHLNLGGSLCPATRYFPSAKR